MIIIGVDYHPEFQQIAVVDTETGELEERRLQNQEEAEKFYRELSTQRVAVRVGMEASGPVFCIYSSPRVPPTNGFGISVQFRCRLGCFLLQILRVLACAASAQSLSKNDARNR